jgi:hypothetical protein
LVKMSLAAFCILIKVLTIAQQKVRAAGGHQL